MKLGWPRLLTLISLLCAVAAPTDALAHGGGTPRLVGEPAGPYRVYAWSEPQPLRAGETHLTIGVTIPGAEPSANDEDETPVTDANVVVTYTPVNGSEDAVTVAAQPQSSLGIVYYEADAELPAAGSWRIEVAVQGTLGAGAAAFEAEIASARRMSSMLIASLGAAAVVGLLALAWRARRRDATEETQRTRPRNAGAAQHSSTR